jgi:hypothetical protein
MLDSTGADWILSRKGLSSSIPGKAILVVCMPLHGCHAMRAGRRVRGRGRPANQHVVCSSCSLDGVCLTLVRKQGAKETRWTRSRGSPGVHALHRPMWFYTAPSVVPQGADPLRGFLCFSTLLLLVCTLRQRLKMTTGMLRHTDLSLLTKKIKKTAPGTAELLVMPAPDTTKNKAGGFRPVAHKRRCTYYALQPDIQGCKSRMGLIDGRCSCSEGPHTV